jgi:hypothetical protein
MNISNVLQVLWNFESSASAYILVRSITDNPCTDQECAAIYENSEGTNDELTEQLLLTLDQTQLAELASILRGLDEDLRDECDGDEDEYLDRTDGMDIESMLA